jgi:hypothetical protein
MLPPLSHRLILYFEPSLANHTLHAYDEYERHLDYFPANASMQTT